MTGKEIWLPKSETRVTITEDGTVSVWDEMVMELRPIQKPPGFGKAKDEEKPKP